MRQVGNVVELVDASGTPRIRATAPFVVDGAQTVREAKLAVSGCSVDTSSAAPWGRPVTPAGSDTCRFTVQWDPQGLTAPLLVDPSWSSTGAMTFGRTKAAGTLLSNGDVLVVGGTSADGLLAYQPVAELYNPTLGIWSVTGSTASAHISGVAGPFSNGNALVFGGSLSVLGELVCLLERREDCSHDAEVYSSATGTWSIAAHAAPLPLDTGMTATALPSGQVLIVGGTNVPNRCTLYPATGTAVSCAKPPQGFYGHTATLLTSGKVLLAGGLGARGLNRTAYLYDPTKNAWSATGATLSTRLYGISARLGDGRVLVTGGGVATAETYSAATGTWTAQPSTSTARLGATLTALSTGKAVAAGGLGATGAYLWTAEEFDPSTNTWSPTSTMVTGRTGHVSVLLSDGQVLVATGSAASTHFLAAAELYTSSATPPPPPPNCDDGNPCTTDTANPDGTCSHTPITDGTVCTDGDACTQADSCQAGVCVGSDPVVCAASDSCHVAGTCNPSTGLCSNPDAPDGTTCSDGNACTTVDACSTGTCVGTRPVVCPAADSCHVAGVCDTMTGACSNPTAPNGTTCSDGNACTQSDSCQAGTCRGSDPVTCNAADACHVPGTCNPASGVCSTPAAPNGTTCSDGNACTQSDSCQAGTCTGSDPVTCTASDACHTAGTCDPSSGACSNPPAPNGTACTDNNACTTGDACQSGSCTPSHTTTCTATDACHVAGTCNPTSGTCSNPVAPDGTTCSDGSLCTSADQCTAGVCAGKPVTCGPSDSCHVAGTCSPTTGACSNPTAPDGTACTDSNACTQIDACQSGACVGANPVLCPMADECHMAACNATTGQCTAGTVSTCPNVDTTVASAVGPTTSFLYTGPSATQVGVPPGTISLPRAAAIRGVVDDTSGSPVAGTTVSVFGHPEYGSTTSALDGSFTLVVNGGGGITLDYNDSRYLRVQRTLPPVGWNAYVDVAPVVLTKLDAAATTVDLSGQTSSSQIATASPSSDASGTRTARLLFPAHSSATFSTGTAPDSLTVRATEYTVGASGPSAMPGTLPPGSGYTYAVELSADEAVAEGATVTFSAPVLSYTDNFLHFTVGQHVPAGFYDRTTATWTSENDGRVIGLVSITNGTANLDLDGDGQADSQAVLTAAGITADEQMQVAVMFSGKAPTSFWRVPIAHFTPWDFNWPFGPPPGSGPPGPPPPAPPYPHPDPGPDPLGGGAGDGTGGGGGGPPCPPGTCCPTGSGDGGGGSGDDDGGGGGGPFGDGGLNASLIESTSGILHESIPLAGTPYSLEYSSDRVLGYKVSNRLLIPYGGEATPFTGIDHVSIDVAVAGQETSLTFPYPPAGATATFDWSGQDALGRLLQGSQPVTVTMGYAYNGVYLTPAQNPIDVNEPLYDETFGHFSYYGVTATADPTRQQVSLITTTTGALGHWDNEAFGLGGWMLSVQQAYDFGTSTLYKGDGTRQHGENFGATVHNVALPGGFQGLVAVSPDGQLAVGYPGGVYYSDGTPIATGLSDYGGFAFGPDGTLYVARHYAQNEIVHIDASGNQTVIGGVPQTGNSGGTTDGNSGPATSAHIAFPGAVAVGPDGSVYFAQANGYASSDGDCIRKIDPSGTMQAVAGVCGSSGITADGAIAASALLSDVGGLAVGADGTVYFSEAGYGYGGVRKIGADGVLHTLATPSSAPGALAVARNGTLYVAADYGIYRIAPNGDVTLLTAVTNNNDCDLGYADGQLASAVHLCFQSTLALSQDERSLYVGPGISTLIRLEVQPTGYAGAPLQVPSQDGSEVYLFDENGRHTDTKLLPSGATRYHFTYTSDGLISSVTDGYGNVTHVQRTGDTPTGIVSPYGVATQLALGADGYLAAAVGPTGADYTMAYESGGLLDTIQFPTGSNTVYSSKTYSADGLGRLASSTSASGRTVTFDASADASSSVSVTKTTGDGVVTSVAMSTTTASGTTATATLPSGAVTSTQIDATGGRIERAPDGTVTTTTYTPDPRFGMQVPIASTTITTPSGLASVTTATRSVTLSDPTDPLSLTSQTDSSTVNGATWTTVYNAASATQTTTSPMGRVTTTTTNAEADPVSTSAPGVAPTSLAYDAQGRLESTTQGTFTQGTAVLPRTYSFSYDAHGYTSSTVDPLANTTTLVNNLAGEPTDTVTPDGTGGTRDLVSSYDGDGNLTSLTLPKGEQHEMTYTPADALASYNPPVLGTGTWATRYDYTIDGLPSHEYRPDGTTVTYTYDTADRLTSTMAPVGSVLRAYDPATGQLTSVSTNWLDGVNEALSFGYDGFLQTRTSWTGTVAGAVTFGYDNNFRMTSRTVSGASVAFGYDLDGLLTGAGGMTIARDPNNGRVTGTTLGGVTDAYTYDANGLLASYVAEFDGALLYSETIDSRDGVGRITQKTDAYSGGESHVWTYAYDAPGRLTDVTEDGQPTGHYEYDLDDNRTLATTAAGGTVTASYDPQDRLFSYGGTTYTYGANGEMQTKTDASGTTAYTYDSFGSLRNVTPPTGAAIDYVIDGMNRRVGRKVGGTLVQGLLYQNQLNAVAELDGAGNLVAQYTYGTKGNVPDVKTDGTGTYRIVSDHLGSPRLIVNTAHGTVSERMDFDEWGHVTFDRAPSTTPFGFAGGIYDQATETSRFGARDFYPTAGRWMSRDPIMFRSGQINLFVYSNNDPINNTDMTGEDDQCKVAQMACHNDPSCQFQNCQNRCASGALDNLHYCYDVCNKFSPTSKCYQGCWTDVGNDYNSCFSPCLNGH